MTLCSTIGTYWRQRHVVYRCLNDGPLRRRVVFDRGRCCDHFHGTSYMMLYCVAPISRMSKSLVISTTRLLPPATQTLIESLLGWLTATFLLLVSPRVRDMGNYISIVEPSSNAREETIDSSHAGIVENLYIWTGSISCL